MCVFSLGSLFAAIDSAHLFSDNREIFKLCNGQRWNAEDTVLVILTGACDLFLSCGGHARALLLGACAVD